MFDANLVKTCFSSKTLKTLFVFLLLHFLIYGHSSVTVFSETNFFYFALPPILQCLVAKFAKINGATMYKFWNPNVTHVIAATDSNGACSRTLKVLMAILNGKWVLSMDCKLHQPWKNINKLVVVIEIY